MNAQEAIERSISHNATVHLDWDSEVHTDLVIESEDSVETNGVIEIWGTDDAGNEWRVHMTAEAEDTSDVPSMSAAERAAARADYDVYC